MIFSEHLYIALPSNNFDKVEINCFIKKCIGLLAVSNEEIVKILKPKKSKICNAIYKYIAVSYLNSKYDTE